MYPTPGKALTILRNIGPAMDPLEPSAAKSALRERMRRTRAAIPVQARQAKSERVAENLFGIPAMEGAVTVLLFYSFGSEIPTSAMVDRLLGSARRVLLPYLDEGGMEAAQLGEDRLLAATTYGPREPSERVAVDPAEIDVVVTPGLAFDSEGHRLGYGAAGGGRRAQ